MSRQIRFIIYSYSLKADRPIYVYDKLARRHAAYHASQRHENYRPYRLHDHVASNLIRCGNRVVAFEAALALYEMNTFIFRPLFNDDAWYTLFDFLFMIGKSNRLQLRNLSVAVEARLQTTKKGANRSVPGLVFDNGKERQAIRIPSLITHHVVKEPKRALDQRASAPTYSTPVIEACFRLLGAAGPPLTLAIEVEEWRMPSAQTRGRSEHVLDNVLPGALEMLRIKHTVSMGGHSRVNLIWRGRKMPGVWTELEMEEVGWDVLALVSYCAPKRTFGNMLDFDIRWRGVDMPNAHLIDTGSQSKPLYPCLEEEGRSIHNVE